MGSHFFMVRVPRLDQDRGTSNGIHIKRMAVEVYLGDLCTYSYK
jgi:hypothetical protein